ncbi:MAG: DUF4097 domain-containing protein [Acidobacteria bacterium]|nr:DUF4097 domain-containing protein [Acidobacteriota bacterium]
MRARSLIRVFVVWAAVLALPGIAGAAAAHFQKSFPAQGISAVKVNVSFHDVQVVVRQTPSVNITVDLTSRDSKKRAAKLFAEYKPSFTVRDGIITVKSLRKHRIWSWGGMSITGKVIVTVPPGIDLNLDTSSGDCEVQGNLGHATIKADTSSGDVTVSGSARRISADTSSGDVRLHLSTPSEEITADTSSGSVSVDGSARKISADTASGDVVLHLDPTAGKVEVDTSSGDVTLTGGAARFSADTSSGDVLGTGLTGNVEANTSSGNVTLAWLKVVPGSNVDIDSGSGEVRLLFPGETALEGRITTSSGDIRSDFPGMTRDHGRLFVLESNTAAATVRISTASGSITLKRR